MSSNKDKPEKGKSPERNKPIDIPNQIARTRTTSGSSAEEGTSSGKRQRTTSQTYMVQGIGSSPPKFVSLEEIMQAANGLKDMALVHQIAVDKDFKLIRTEPAEGTIEKKVKDTVHKAFWDILKLELEAKPPKYNQAFKLFEEIKESLLSLLLPQHTKIKQQILETLDTQLIKQQAEKGILDFHQYAQYVVSTMAKLCAPVRDETVKQLTQKLDVIETFKGILEMLDLMALDMANFTLELAKPEIIKHSVEYERKKFADILKVQEDGLQHTRKWLLNHLDQSVKVTEKDDYNTFVKNLTKSVFVEATIDLLEWDYKNGFPETFMLDEERLADLNLRMQRCIFLGTALLITFSNVSPDLQSLSSFKEDLKKHFSVIMEETKSVKEMEEALSNLADQAIEDIKQSIMTHKYATLSEEKEKLIKDTIKEAAKPQQKIRQLVRQRIKEFFISIIESSTAAPQKVPTGLTILQKELTAIAGQFLRVVSHNSTVYCIYYFDIIAAALPKA